MLAMPASTAFDLNFRLFGIPVRISPWFWLVSLMMGSESLKDGEITTTLVWVGIVFVSILIHEMGHGLTAKWFGERPSIALYGMGGLCTSDPNQTPPRRLAILLMGPGAQFLLLGVVFAVGWLKFGITYRGDWLLIRELFGFPPDLKAANGVLDPGLIELGIAAGRMRALGMHAYYNLIYINLFWALVNLLPIYPLDGGQITQILLIGHDRFHGARRTHIVSMITSGAIAAWAASRLDGSGTMGSLFPVLFFGAFAFMNFQMLQAHHDHYVRNGPDDADWWKR